MLSQMEKRHKASLCQLQSIFFHGQGLILFNTLFIMLTGMYPGVVQRIFWPLNLPVEEYKIQFG